MIPSVLAAQFRKGLIDYMETSYPVTSPIFEGSLRRFLETENVFFHEPYISVKLPFRTAERCSERFESIHIDYTLYVHQNIAFDRLDINDPRSTLIATGTGSGKTECFLYPILEYCYQHRTEPGIKALIIYPMNALASDQAQRTAKLIYESPELKGNITVGMYVGGQGENESKIMQPEKVITDHETLLMNPPDILLTNYKMLDYLLVRPRDAALWSRNTDPDTLRFIVVDELHTFDGAQGTDLACLLRRLKSRLKIQPGYLCCVGTSATMGGPESKAPMLRYAREVFGEPFEDDAIITEDRLTGHEFFGGKTVSYYRLPNQDEAKALSELARQEKEDDYLLLSTRAWFEEDECPQKPLSGSGRVELSEKLMRHSFFQSLISVMNNRYIQSTALCDEISNVYPIMSTDAGKAILDSILALVSHARNTDAKGRLRPFLQVQLQLWMRELRRVLGKVDNLQSDFILETDLNRLKTEHKEHYLPVVNCRDCGATGWAGAIDEQNRLNISDIKVFYNQYFAYDKRIRMVFPRREEDENTGIHQKARLCPQCLYVQNEQNAKCGSCGHDIIPVWTPNVTVNKKAKGYVCPFCGSAHGLILVGLRSATAISAGISQLYGSRFNDDKKLLAFNDNVQDAAHRASFFNARTWRFGLRIAMQHFVDDGGEGLGIADFCSKLSDYWLQRMSEEDFIDTLIPHSMTSDRAYETLQRDGKFPNAAAGRSLLNDLKKRIAYEALLEYGMNSRTGRTLEKSCASMTAPDTEAVRRAASEAYIKIQNEAGVRELTSEQLIGFILLWMNHMRLNGAFAMPVYKSYVESGANGYLLSRRHISWMPDAYNEPLFVAPAFYGFKGEFETLDEHCWYMRKLRSLIDKTDLECPGMLQALSIIIAEMENHKLITRMAGPKCAPVFGLNPEMYSVNTHIGLLKCNVCGQTVNVPEEQAEQWKNMTCGRANCRGHYVFANKLPDYFANMYANGDLVRIHAREHTGLIKREEREQLETAFKHDKKTHKSWDPNLLSCTPTLEMGIDIGDLSTIVLCSIPPAQSQYLQRIGRAGRTDGNALTIAVAASKPHDLYFYQEPLEMISGKVEPPGVFLNASAVLERQFVAFCMDNWVKSGITESAIPMKVKGVLSKINQENEPVDVFPFNFLSYIHANLSRLSRMFEQMFDKDELTEVSRNRIRDFAKGTGDDHESLRNRILHAFTELYEQRESLKKDIKKLKKAIDDLSEKPKDSSFDEQKKELWLERKGLISVQQEMEDRNIFNFLSDEGLLPNYAFPEAGIILKAILTRKVALSNNATEEQTIGYERYSYEYNRSASTAISEFAPENSFYAGGHKLKIDQVDVSTTEPEQWRLCPNCNHAAPVSSLHNIAACPRCGSLAWADQGQVKTMLRVRTVYSTNRYEESVTGDENEDRINKFYSREMLVDINEDEDVVSGYQTTKGDLPFGYEFISKATLREINFGESENIGTKLKVAGREEIRNGFRICKYCGKIQPKSPKTKPAHTKICRAMTQSFKEPFEECMFLYREFTSEAIRILIPSTSMDTSTVKMESFAAAIMLGLKKKFNNVDHLGYCIMDAPVPEADYRKKYMVLYDSVPGGTGYLKQLMVTPGALMEIFELALKAMETCACVNETGKDGCYHCLYAYRQSYKINNISRSTAVELLRKIISGKDSIEPIKSVSAISVNTLFDSELEKRFIEAIEQSSSNCKIDIMKTPVHGKEGYFLQIGSCCWDIELQAPFNNDRNIPIPSRADFVFWPKTKGNKQRPVAVFTDGFLYHKQIADTDSNKRMAIRSICGYPVWSLTWKDVQDKLSGHSVRNIDTLNADNMPFAKYYDKALQKRSLPKWDLKNMSAFDLLVRYLAEPNADDIFIGYAQALSLAMIDQKKSILNNAFDEWNAGYSILSELDNTVQAAKYKKVLFGTWEPAPGMKIYSCLPTIAVTGIKTKEGNTLPEFDEKACSTVIRLDDTKPEKGSAFENAWAQFLLAGNVLQFLKDNAIVTDTGIETGIYSWRTTRAAITGIRQETPDRSNDEAEKWDALIRNELFDTDAISIARKLQGEGCPAPECVGYEKGGEVLAELAWTTRKIAVQIPSQAEYRNVLETTGWKVFDITTSDGITNAIKEGL